MTSVEHIAELFAELGPQTPEVEAVSQHGESASWAVALEDGLILEVALVETRGMLSFSSPLGRPEPDAQVAVYEAVLMYNALRDSTDGVTVVLAESGGDLALVYDLDLRDLTAVTLQTVVLNFAAKARLWRDVVANGAAVDPSSGDSEDLYASSIRV